MKRLIKAMTEATKILEQADPDLKKVKSVKYEGMTILVWKMENDPIRGDLFTYSIDGDTVKDLDIGPRPFFPSAEMSVKNAQKEIDDQIKRNVLNVPDQTQNVRKND